MRKYCSFILIAIMIFGMLPKPVFARDFVRIPTPTTGIVTEILDVNAISVRLGNGDEALVRLIGISPGGSENALAFLTGQILGEMVFMSREGILIDRGRWNYMHVSLGGQNISTILLAGGYAVLYEPHSRIMIWPALTAAQDAARSNNLGIWAEGLMPIAPIHFGVRLNINTATVAQIVAQLELPWPLAQAIVTHRNTAVFQHVNDLVFVSGMTRAIFEEIRHRVTVSTNLNAAFIEELMTLTNINYTLANQIVSYRNINRIVNLDHLVRDNVLSQAIFNQNVPFMSIDNVERITFSRPGYMANANTASAAQLQRAGMTAAQATNTIDQRSHMPLRNLSDMRDLPGFGAAQIHNLSDNLRFMTNINLATRHEIESLFGANPFPAEVNAILANRPFTTLEQVGEHLLFARFNAIAPFIYLNERPADNIVNFNTASHAQLMAAGFTAAQASAISANNVQLRRPSDLTRFNLGANARLGTVLTNINRASIAEIQSLDPAMTLDIATRLIAYRNDQPFGTMAQLAQYFASINQQALFLRIERHIILR